jgi:Zn-dependent protease
MFGANINLAQIVLYLLAVIVSISFHEFSHAWSASELGDPTAKRMGRMTLNPIAHFDPLGALMIVYMAIGGRGLGWGKPVPVNTSNLRGNPRVSMGLTAAAGPFSNLVLAAVAAIPFRLGLSMPGLLDALFQALVYTNVGLAVFNLIPLPPLDGFNVIQGLLGTFRTRWAYEWGDRLDRMASYGPILLLALLALGWFGGLNILGRIMGPPMTALLGLLLG